MHAFQFLECLPVVLYGRCKKPARVGDITVKVLLASQDLTVVQFVLHYVTRLVK